MDQCRQPADHTGHSPKQQTPQGVANHHRDILGKRMASRPPGQGRPDRRPPHTAQRRHQKQRRQQTPQESPQPHHSRDSPQNSQSIQAHNSYRDRCSHLPRNSISTTPSPRGNSGAFPAGSHQHDPPHPSTPKHHGNIGKRRAVPDVSPSRPPFTDSSWLHSAQPFEIGTSTSATHMTQP